MTILELSKELESLQECKKEAIWLLDQIEQHKIIFATGMSRKTHVAYYPYQVTEDKKEAIKLNGRIKRATTKILRENLKRLDNKITKYNSILDVSVCDTCDI